MHQSGVMRLKKSLVQILEQENQALAPKKEKMEKDQHKQTLVAVERIINNEASKRELKSGEKPKQETSGVAQKP